MMSYPVVLTPDGDGFVVTFPDFPEAVTQGDTEDEALREAVDCLDEAIAARMSAREALPAPRRAKRLRTVEPSFDVAAKAALYEAVRAQDLNISALARRLEVGETEVRRLLDPHHQTRLSKLDKVARKLGKRLRVELVDL